MEKVISQAKHYWKEHKTVVVVVAAIIVIAIIL
jgi:hypothetical protein